MKEGKLPWESIALIDFGSPELGHATGFFADVEGWGKVCITNAHVFSTTLDPANLDREEVFIFERRARLLFDGWSAHKRDVALVEVPEDLKSVVHYHRLGFSSDKYRLFYSVGWSLNGVTKGKALKKIWGLRDLTVQAPAGGNSATWFWELQSKIEQASPVDRFQRGWSGAPVFNVRRRGEEDCVIGILQAVTKDDNAYAYAIQSLDFLKPSEKQEQEGRTVRTIPTFWKRVFSLDVTEAAYEIGFEDSYHDIKHEEIVGGPVVRPQKRPDSPYDYALT